MKHRIFKNVAPSTNKQDLPRDLVSYESVMQSLRFVAAGWQDLQFPAVVGSGLRELFQSGVFESSYIESDCEPWKPEKDEDSLICDEDVTNIRLHGRKLTQAQVHQQGLPPSPLSLPQVGELGDAYKEQGDATLKLSNKVSYFNGVSYRILAADICDGRGIWKETGWVKVTVRVDDVLEVLSEIDGRSFVKVLGIMLHERSVFLVVKWLMPTGQHHPRFYLPEYVEEPLFAHAAFFSLKTIDHPRFVNQTFFHDLGNGKLIRNDWIFNAA